MKKLNTIPSPIQATTCFCKIIPWNSSCSTFQKSLGLDYRTGSWASLVGLYLRNTNLGIVFSVLFFLLNTVWERKLEVKVTYFITVCLLLSWCLLVRSWCLLIRFSLIPGLTARSFSSVIRYLSTCAAACRPSEIAHTTSDWPRRQSPAAKTPSTLVEKRPYSALKFDRLSRSTPNFSATIWKTKCGIPVSNSLLTNNVIQPHLISQFFLINIRQYMICLSSDIPPGKKVNLVAGFILKRNYEGTTK